MLINCVAYRQGRKIGDIPIHQISEILTEPNTFVWVALKEPTLAELEDMQRQFKLHPLAVEDAQHGHQRPKIEEYGDSLFAVLHTIEMIEHGEIHSGEVAVFVGPNYVLSARHRTLKGFTAVRERCEREPELLKFGSAFVLYALMDTVVDRYFPVVADLESELDQIEEQIFASVDSERENIERLYDLKRKLMMVQHAAAPLAAAITRLYGGRVPQICVGMNEYFRDVDDHLNRTIRTIDNIREMLTTAIQVNFSLIAIKESEVNKKLAAYAALFAVPTAIAGIYGMNFKYMPELEHPWGYPIVLAVIVFGDLGLFLYLKSVKWL